MAFSSTGTSTGRRRHDPGKGRRAARGNPAAGSRGLRPSHGDTLGSFPALATEEDDVMAECLGCLGAGFHDFFDMDTYLEEHLTDEQLAYAKAQKRLPWKGRVTCEVCEGTGVISDDLYKDMM